LTDATHANGLSIILEALAFAAGKHRDQRRKGSDASPYINHPIAVANILVNEGAVTDPLILCAAILHDTIEDTGTTPEELSSRFGPEITGIVQEVTDDKSLPKADRKRLQIEHAPHLTERARTLKLADKISNLRDMASHPPHDWTMERRIEYFRWAARVVEGLRGVNPALEAAFDRAYELRPPG
jgi:guanosine-3',5'-bis(diphosphate) 3'-pyrophosphohydrolase